MGGDDAVTPDKFARPQSRRDTIVASLSDTESPRRCEVDAVDIQTLNRIQVEYVEMSTSFGCASPETSAVRHLMISWSTTRTTPSTFRAS